MFFLNSSQRGLRSVVSLIGGLALVLALFFLLSQQSPASAAPATFFYATLSPVSNLSHLAFAESNVPPGAIVGLNTEDGRQIQTEANFSGVFVFTNPAGNKAWQVVIGGEPVEIVDESGVWEKITDDYWFRTSPAITITDWTSPILTIQTQNVWQGELQLGEGLGFLTSTLNSAGVTSFTITNTTAIKPLPSWAVVTSTTPYATKIFTNDNWFKLNEPKRVVTISNAYSHDYNWLLISTTVPITLEVQPSTSQPTKWLVMNTILFWVEDDSIFQIEGNDATIIVDNVTGWHAEDTLCTTSINGCGPVWVRDWIKIQGNQFEGPTTFAASLSTTILYSSTTSDSFIVHHEPVVTDTSWWSSFSVPNCESLWLRGESDWQPVGCTWWPAEPIDMTPVATITPASTHYVVELEPNQWVPASFQVQLCEGEILTMTTQTSGTLILPISFTLPAEPYQCQHFKILGNIQVVNASKLWRPWDEDSSWFTWDWIKTFLPTIIR